IKPVVRAKFEQRHEIQSMAVWVIRAGCSVRQVRSSRGNQCCSLDIIDAGIIGLQAPDDNGRTSSDYSFVPKC
ncbi:uncharacterized protein METZ01_LOCUS458335, partial [marine metagenome]